MINSLFFAHSPSKAEPTWSEKGETGVPGQVNPTEPYFMGMPVKVGDIIALSNREGAWPFLIQLGTLSPTDHMGVVVIKEGLYHLADSSVLVGVRLRPLANLEAKVQKKGLHFCIGRLPVSLTHAQEETLLSGTLALLGTKYSPTLDCLIFLHRLFRQTGLALGKWRHIETLNLNLLGGLGPLLRKVIPEFERRITPLSIMEDLTIIGHNFPNPQKILRWTEEDFYDAWGKSGDLWDIHRVVEGYRPSLNESAPSFQRYLDLLAKRPPA